MCDRLVVYNIFTRVNVWHTVSIQYPHTFKCLGKSTAAAKAALPSPTSACWVFSCYRNPPPNSDMDYRIFNVRTWSVLCVLRMGNVDQSLQRRNSNQKTLSSNPWQTRVRGSFHVPWVNSSADLWPPPCVRHEPKCVRTLKIPYLSVVNE